MSRQEVSAKSMNLMGSLLGEKKARTLIDTVMNLEQVGNIRELQPLLSI